MILTPTHGEVIEADPEDATFTVSGEYSEDQHTLSIQVLDDPDNLT